ncbi:MAG: hypothetical protein WCV50_04285 [Patescibacteria group bacterium]|jgi:hypothetical protein
MKNTKKIILIVALIIILAIIGGIYFFLTRVKDVNVNTSAQANINSATNNANIETNENVNQPPTLNTNQEIEVSGKILVKGYDTPSESYGIFTTDRLEIGLGKYDSMKEQFRQYIGENIKVNFSSVCRSGIEDCCRTLFYYCGTVKSWEPLE